MSSCINFYHSGGQKYELGHQYKSNSCLMTITNTGCGYQNDTKQYLSFQESTSLDLEIFFECACILIASYALFEFQPNLSPTYLKHCQMRTCDFKLKQVSITSQILTEDFIFRHIEIELFGRLLRFCSHKCNVNTYQYTVRTMLAVT